MSIWIALHLIIAELFTKMRMLHCWQCLCALVIRCAVVDCMNIIYTITLTLHLIHTHTPHTSTSHTTHLTLTHHTTHEPHHTRTTPHHHFSPLPHLSTQQILGTRGISIDTGAKLHITQYGAHDNATYAVVMRPETRFGEGGFNMSVVGSNGGVCNGRARYLVVFQGKGYLSEDEVPVPISGCWCVLMFVRVCVCLCACADMCMLTVCACVGCKDVWLWKEWWMNGRGTK